MDMERILKDNGHPTIQRFEERASQIFQALDGLEIWEAVGLLEDCERALYVQKLHYHRSC